MRRVFGIILMTFMSAGATHQGDTCTISIQVRSPDGEPFGGIPVALVAGEQAAIGMTSRDGTVELECDAGAESAAVCVDPLVLADLGADRPSLNRLDRILQDWVFAPVYPVAMAPGVARTDVVVEAAPAIMAAGRTVDGAGRPVGATIAGRDSAIVAQSDPASGRFRVLGVPRDRESDLLIGASADVMAVVHLDAERASRHVNLADVIVPEVGGAHRIVLLDTPLEGDANDGRGDDLTLIDADGTTVWLVRARGGTAEVHLPEGTYYVAPGRITDDPVPGALLDLIRAGAVPEKISPISVNGQGPAVIVFDSESITEAALAAAHPPADRLVFIPELGRAPVPPPHPLITEILYAVPTGDAGDATGDGLRHVSGDEFIELINPHDRPIDLGGYMLTDRNPPESGQMRFVFPACTLEPGGIVVVFNGCGTIAPGPVGDETAAPPGPNPAFGGALVFTMNAASQRIGLANSADHVLLRDRSGNPIQAVVWGGHPDQPPQDTCLIEPAPRITGTSIQRRALDGPWQRHDGGARFSPGVFAPSVVEPD